VRQRHRRFGPGPYLTGLRKDPAAWGAGFPYDVPAVDAVDTLDLSGPITLLAGDNGTGKSTIVEAIAEAMGFAAEGGELERSGELPAVPRRVMREALEPVLTHAKPHNGYYLRAESFFNVDSEGIFSPDLSLYGGVPLHEQSHGQSFLALASNRARRARRGAV
jgi:predicted ATPase